MKLGPIDLLIFQSTSFCNLDCKYCYLPDRANNNKIDIEIIRTTLKRVAEENLIENQFSIVWHAGEPTVMPISFYREVNSFIKEYIPNNIKVNQHIQTNATLLNDEWCEFFIESGMKVGVSIDGTKHITDRNRVYRNSKGSFDIIIKKIELLKKHNIEFSVIAVVTDYSLDYADEIYDFFKQMGVKSLCFNMDEEDGINAKSTLNNELKEKYKSFFKTIFNRQLVSNDYMHIREIHGFNQAMLKVDVSDNSFYLGQMTQPLRILAIDTNGFFTTFSPELLGMKDDRYGDFNLGNVKTDTISSIIENEKFKKMFTEILSGIKKCKDECEYFSLCGGGAPSNKYYENGSFDTTETNFCLFSKKLLVDTFLTEIENKI